MDKALEAVNAAKEALVEVGSLRNVVDEAAKLTGETDKYTEDSLKALQAAIDEARKVLGNPKATKDEVATALNAVNKKQIRKTKNLKKKNLRKTQPTRTPVTVPQTVAITMELLPRVLETMEAPIHLPEQQLQAEIIIP